MTHSMMTDTASDAGRSVADVLDAAADLLSKPGAWTQGEYVGINGDCWCALGAIRRFTGSENDFSAPGQALRRVIKFDSIADWNDEPGRSQFEVVAAFREAAQASRQEQQKEGDA